MNTTFKALVIFTALAIFTFVATLPVSAAPLGTVASRHIAPTEVTAEADTQVEAPVQTLDITSTVAGSKANTHVIQPKPARHHNDDASAAPLMQDLTQCQLTNNGELVCIDVCGGLSVPGSICSFE
jgi:hypothetical protein